MKLIKTLTALMLVISLMLPVQFADAISKGKPDPNAPPGTWYVGEDPAPKTGQPILFVHGLTGSASTWFEPNDMFQQARNAGHPTAFINLYPDKSNWDNGAMLAEKLADMYAHFGEKIIVVGHSKGGIDTQTALYHNNAESYVSKVITLGTPHHGSQLANLAYSNWAGWLAAIIGMRSEGTDSLQTGTMAHFRSITDPLVTQQTVPTSTLSGKSIGSFGSALWFGGIYLNAYGANDGSVTVNSSRLSYAPEFASLSLDHFAINQGHLVFPHLRNQLANVKTDVATERSIAETGTIVRGGEFLGAGDQPFFIEEGVNSIAVSILASEELTSAEFIAPSGQSHAVKTVQAEHENSLFHGAVAHHFEVNSPESGEWTIQMKHKDGASYLAVAALEGGISSAIQTVEGTIASNIDAKTIDLSKTTFTVHLNDQEVHADQPVNSAKLFSLPAEPDTSQTITVDIEGKTMAGEAFERTIITHQYIDKNGKVFE